MTFKVWEIWEDFHGSLHFCFFVEYKWNITCWNLSPLASHSAVVPWPSSFLSCLFCCYTSRTHRWITWEVLVLVAEEAKHLCLLNKVFQHHNTKSLGRYLMNSWATWLHFESLFLWKFVSECLILHVVVILSVHFYMWTTCWTWP